MPTPRPRARVISGAGRKPLAVFYSPAEYREWQATAAAELGGVSAAYNEGPLSVHVLCVSKKPKTSKLPAPRPDVDNLGKSILDAITKDGRFWKDDAQVVNLTVLKRWGESDSITVSIEPATGL